MERLHYISTLIFILWISTVVFIPVESSSDSDKLNGEQNSQTNLSRPRRAALSSYSFSRDVIPGTHLKTGTFYNIRMKKFPLGFVSFSTRKHDTGYNYVFVDNAVSHRPNYRKGGEWHRDAQWAFLTSSEPGWYHLINRAVPCQYATWSDSESIDAESTLYIILDPNHPGTHTENDFLFKVEQPSGDNVDVQPFYQLKLKSLPNAVISWNAGNSTNQAFYIHVETTDQVDWLRRYSWGHVWYDDTLFSFEEVNEAQESQKIEDEEEYLEIIGGGQFSTLIGQPGYDYSMANRLISNLSIVMGIMGSYLIQFI